MGSNCETFAFNISYLYHATPVNVGGQWSEKKIRENIPLPPTGTFHNDIVHKKWFTVSPLSCSLFCDPDCKNVILRYTVKKPLKLVIIMEKDYKKLSLDNCNEITKNTGAHGFIDFDGSNNIPSICLPSSSQYIHPIPNILDKYVDIPLYAKFYLDKIKELDQNKIIDSIIDDEKYSLNSKEEKDFPSYYDTAKISVPIDLDDNDDIETVYTIQLMVSES